MRENAGGAMLKKGILVLGLFTATALHAETGQDAWPRFAPPGWRSHPPVPGDHTPSFCSRAIKTLSTTKKAAVHTRNIRVFSTTRGTNWQGGSGEACPDDLLPFMHRVPCTHMLHSGKPVIQYLYDSHFDTREIASRCDNPGYWNAGRHAISINPPS